MSLNNIFSNLNVTAPESAVIYLRSSSAEQNNDANHAHSIVTQRNLCMSYCNRNNLNVLLVIEEIRRANDITKLKINKIPEQYENIHLVVADPSRISRDIADGASFLKKCNKKNITIHSVRDDSISSTSIGKRKIMDLIGVANEESDTVSKRIRSMINIKKKYGSKFGVAPFGYTNSITNVTKNGLTFPINSHIPLQREQDIIKLIGYLRFGCKINVFYDLFRRIINNPNKVLYYEGNEWIDIQDEECTIKFIASVLNDNNILKRGKPWSESSVSSIIKKLKDKSQSNSKANTTINPVINKASSSSSTRNQYHEDFDLLMEDDESDNDIRSIIHERQSSVTQTQNVIEERQSTIQHNKSNNKSTTNNDNLSVASSAVSSIVTPRFNRNNFEHATINTAPSTVNTGKGKIKEHIKKKVNKLKEVMESMFNFMNDDSSDEE